MLKDLNYRPILIDELITNERLSSYKAVFLHNSDAELIGAYLWNTKVCAAFYPLLISAEVTLRNAIDTALSNDLGRFWWKAGKLHYKSFDGVNVPFECKAVTENFQKAFAKVRSEKRSRYNQNRHTPSHNEIVSKSEFSTWEFILNEEYMGPNLIWPKNLGKVFRGKWPSKTSTTLKVARELVKVVREFRNRVSHHEPVWKRYGIKNEAEAINHLNEKLDKILSLIALVSPHKLELLVKSGIVANAKRVCTIGELRNNQQTSQIHSVKSVSKLYRLVKSANNENTSKNIVLFNFGKVRFTIAPF